MLGYKDHLTDSSCLKGFVIQTISGYGSSKSKDYIAHLIEQGTLKRIGKARNTAYVLGNKTFKNN
ncbi:hypothetical protein Q757_07250 [Oenococcus alcoholitolerans]|uniref:Uncharacterized protein n=1 Tax=Oenococcus alcoholitolerans TaxID=931074 RepID=A0ABR4XQ00_9LACO|nr:hypothetical protein Q757_07250 [Oenococcus alcoholitolerans]